PEDTHRNGGEREDDVERGYRSRMTVCVCVCVYVRERERERERERCVKATLRQTEQRGLSSTSFSEGEGMFGPLQMVYGSVLFIGNVLQITVLLTCISK